MFKFFRRLILLLIVFGLFATGGYVYFYSSKDYHFSNYEYVNTNVGSKLNGFKIAYISDINIEENDDSVKRLKNIVKDLDDNPYDMVLFGGDLFDNAVYKSTEVAQILKDIDSNYGKFAILGDKDQEHSLEIQQILNDGGFEVLNNEERKIHYKDSSFQLIACDEDTDITKFKDKTETIKICLTHQPDSFSTHQGNIDLQLSGHSFGGSIYIPYYGPLFETEGAKKYNHGEYIQSGSTLLVSNGLTPESAFPYKFLARNEINFITLKTTSSDS